MKNMINFIVKNVQDRKLKGDRCLSKYDITIQSGCALTTERNATLADNVGENISNRNPS